MAKKTNTKREALLNAAEQLFFEKGFNSTTLLDISQLSGVPIGNIYYYYKTKEAFLEQLLTKETDRLNTLKSKLGESADLNDLNISRLAAEIIEQRANKSS